MDADRSFCGAAFPSHPCVALITKGFETYESILYRKHQGFTILVA
jgi:hypothetical protein